MTFSNRSSSEASSGPLHSQFQSQLIPHENTVPAAPATGLHSATASIVGTRQQRFSINQLTTLRSSFCEDLTHYTQASVSAIGVSWRKLQEFGIQRGVRCVNESGLAVSSLGWVGGFTGQHGVSLKETLREAQRAIRIAAQLRAPNVIIVSGPLAGHITPHARRLVISSLRDLASIADRYGITLSLKPMAPLFRNNWTFVHTLEAALDLVNTVDHRRVRLTYGTYHHWQEDRVLDLLRQSARLISHVQLADWKQPRDENDQMLPGEGCIPLGETLQCLEEAGYFGWLELEVWSRDLWKLRTPDLIRRCLSSMDHLLKTSATLTDPPIY